MAAKTVLIKMDKERHLKFGINGMIEFEELTGTKLAEMKAPSVSQIRAIFFVALKWEDKSLTEEQVGELMSEYADEHGMEALVGYMDKLIGGNQGNVAVPSK